MNAEPVDLSLGMPAIRAQVGPDHKIGEIAAVQHGRVTTAQLRDAGLSSSAIDRRVQSGRLHRERRGVFAVGFQIVTRESAYASAVLAVGDDAALSHVSCAGLRGLRTDIRKIIDVSVPRPRGGGRQPDVKIHRLGAALHPDDLDIVDSIPCTAVPRTLIDAAVDVSFDDLRWMIRAAEIARGLDLVALDDAKRRARGHHGLRPLAQALAAYHPKIAKLESRLELRFFDLVLAARLPEPEVQVKLLGRRADFYWPHARLVVETDGDETHGIHGQRAIDRARDARLRAAGFVVLRFSYADVFHHSARTIAQVSRFAGRGPTRAR
jgi:very-short-patch-repair endonuclease